MCASASAPLAQQPPAAGRRATAIRVGEAPAIDGVLDDVWVSLCRLFNGVPLPSGGRSGPAMSPFGAAVIQKGVSKKRSNVTEDRARFFCNPAGEPPDVFARPPRRTQPESVTAPRSPAEPRANVFADPTAPPAARTGSPLDPSAILASVGEVPYVWDIATDALSWGINAADVLTVRDPEVITSGRAYAKLLDPGTVLSRFDVVMKSTQRDEGHGVPYQVQYSLRSGEGTLWIEDTGRWFAGSAGTPVRAHGVVRVINERHAQEERLSYLSRFDELTGEMESLAPHEGAGEALACNGRGHRRVRRRGFGSARRRVDRLSTATWHGCAARPASGERRRRRRRSRDRESAATRRRWFRRPVRRAPP